MPRKSPAPRPWVTPLSDHVDGRGRPRTGPRGRAVRELPRLTIRAEQVAVDRWRDLLRLDARPAHVVFREMVDWYRRAAK